MNNTKYILAILLVLLSAGLAACGNSPAPGDEYIKLMRYIEAGEVDKAMNHVSLATPELANARPEQIRSIFSSQTRKLADLGGIENMEVISETISGATAIVKIKTTYGNGTTVEEAPPMIRLDGAWKLEIGVASENPNRASTGRASPAPGNANTALVQSYIFGALLKCNDSYFGKSPTLPGMSMMIEIIEPRIEVNDLRVNDADRANGIDWMGRVLVRAKMYRQFEKVTRGGRIDLKPHNWINPKNGVPLFMRGYSNNYNVATIKDGEVALQYFDPYKHNWDSDSLACEKLLVATGQKSAVPAPAPTRSQQQVDVDSKSPIAGKNEQAQARTGGAQPGSVSKLNVPLANSAIQNCSSWIIKKSGPVLEIDADEARVPFTLVWITQPDRTYEGNAVFSSKNGSWYLDSLVTSFPNANACNGRLPVALVSD